MPTRSLPYGICRTFFFNACDRKSRLRSKRRPCFTAYVGHGRTFRSRRFPTDSLGESKAFALACKWRTDHGGFLTVRTCDVAKFRRRYSRRPRRKPRELLPADLQRAVQRFADIINRRALGSSRLFGPTFFDTAPP